MVSAHSHAVKDYGLRAMPGSLLLRDHNEASADERCPGVVALKGRITYCNDVFLRIAGYSEQECLGQPHSMIRHPDMPRCVFGLLWETIQDGREIFAYVINRCKNGDHYWVNAHVTPSRNGSGTIIGYHSNRRVPDRRVLDEKIIPLYKELLAEEAKHTNRKSGLQALTEIVVNVLNEHKMDYDEFVATL